MGEAANDYAVFETAGGFCAIAWNAKGVVRFQLPTSSANETERLMLRRLPGARPASPPADIGKTIAAVQRYFAGEPADFADVQLDLSEEDEAFRAIYEAARRVAWGETTTYGALASAIGRGPEAARDVGQAMARNPVALIIPCHRVLAAGGKLGGFSAPGGASSKQKMLELEGKTFAAAEPAQQSLAF